MNSFRLVSLSCATVLFLMMAVGQVQCVFNEGMRPTFAQERQSGQTGNARRCMEIGMHARKQHEQLQAGKKQLLRMAESAQARIDEIHRSEQVDYERSGRMHFILLLATIQSNKQSEYEASALTLQKDAVSALATHEKARQDIPEKVMQVIVETSSDLDTRIRRVDGLVAEMKEVIAHPERLFPKAKKE